MVECICERCGKVFRVAGSRPMNFCNFCLGLQEKPKKKKKQSLSWLDEYERADRLGQWAMVARHHHMTYGQFSARSDKLRLISSALMAHRES